MVAALVEDRQHDDEGDEFAMEMQNQFNEMMQEMRAQDRQLAQLRNLRRETDASHARLQRMARGNVDPPPPYNEVVPPNQPQPHHQPERVDPEPNQPQPHHQPERVDPQPHQRVDPVRQPEPEPEPEPELEPDQPQPDQPQPAPVQPDYSILIVCLLVVDTILLSLILMRN